MSVVGRESVHALYDERFVTFGEDDVYQQSDAAGFIRLFALPARVRAIKDQELAAADASGNGTSPAIECRRRRRAGRRAGRRLVVAPETSTMTNADARMHRRTPGPRSDAQALGWAVRRRPLAGVRRAQQLHRRRLPALAVRRPPLQGVGGGALGRRRAHARGEQGDRARARRAWRVAARGAASSRMPSDEDVHTLIDRLLHEEVGRRRVASCTRGAAATTRWPPPRGSGRWTRASGSTSALRELQRVMLEQARSARDGAHAVVHAPAARHPGVGARTGCCRTSGRSSATARACARRTRGAPSCRSARARSPGARIRSRASCSRGRSASTRSRRTPSTR